eukprot:Gb_22015 [translate_table: standard]
MALIVGVTGLVGSRLAEMLSASRNPNAPSKVYGVARRPKPEWFSDNLTQYILCDVLSRDETLEKLSVLKDVTHLFWLTWASPATEEQSCENNGRMLRNVLDALLPNAHNFQHVCLLTGVKQYIGGFSQRDGEVDPCPSPFTEDLPRLPVLNFYHTLEDILLDLSEKNKGLTWSVHRPSYIMGCSTRSVANLLSTLAAYATICKYEGKPLRFPGNRSSWEQLTDASDAELVAEQLIWAVSDPRAKNQAFNCTNGDVFRWKRLWKILADKFELEFEEYRGEGFSLPEEMKDKGSLWDAIGAEYNLCKTKLEDLAHWGTIGVVFNFNFENLSSMNKSREHGFLGFRNTEKVFTKWIDKLKENRIIP